MTVKKKYQTNMKVHVLSLHRHHIITTLGTDVQNIRCKKDDRSLIYDFIGGINVVCMMHIHTCFHLKIARVYAFAFFWCFWCGYPYTSWWCVWLSYFLDLSRGFWYAELYRFAWGFTYGLGTLAFFWSGLDVLSR